MIKPSWASWLTKYFLRVFICTINTMANGKGGSLLLEGLTYVIVSRLWYLTAWVGRYYLQYLKKKWNSYYFYKSLLLTEVV